MPCQVGHLEGEPIPDEELVPANRPDILSAVPYMVSDPDPKKYRLGVKLLSRDNREEKGEHQFSLYTRPEALHQNLHRLGAYGVGVELCIATLKYYREQAGIDPEGEPKALPPRYDVYLCHREDKGYWEMMASTPDSAHSEMVAKAIRETHNDLAIRITRDNEPYKLAHAGSHELHEESEFPNL